MVAAHCAAVAHFKRLSLAIGRGGQNVRLAAKLTGWNIDIVSAAGEQVAEASDEGMVDLIDPATVPDADPAEAAGLMPTESVEMVDTEVPQETTLTAEEELTPLPASDETVADKEEDRDKANDE
jgi:N utilization substance protein A